MSLRIFKYDMEKCESGFRVNLPFGAKILTVQAQRDEPKLWALVDDFNTPEYVPLWVFGTGRLVPSEALHALEYVATFQLQGGDLVFHVFKERRP